MTRAAGGETCLAGTENQILKKTHSFMGFVDIFGHKFRRQVSCVIKELLKVMNPK